MNDYLGYKINVAKSYLLKARRILEHLNVLNNKASCDFMCLLVECEELIIKQKNRKKDVDRSDSNNSGRREEKTD
jgi:hypothetical protein